MKKLFFVIAISLAIFSCNTPSAPSAAASDSKDSTVKAMYEKNLATLKAGITAFENKQMDAWAATVADSAVWISPAYGSAPAKKDDWKKALTMYTENWDSIKLENAAFLPGIDSATKELDGSVRYYGIWTGKHKSGVKTAVNFYGTYDFNKDNKVVSGADFFDVGGLMNAVAPKAK